MLRPDKTHMWKVRTGCWRYVRSCWENMKLNRQLTNFHVSCRVNSVYMFSVLPVAHVATWPSPYSHTLKKHAWYCKICAEAKHCGGFITQPVGDHYRSHGAKIEESDVWLWLTVESKVELPQKNSALSYVCLYAQSIYAILNRKQCDLTRDPRKVLLVEVIKKTNKQKTIMTICPSVPHSHVTVGTNCHISCLCGLPC